MPIVVETRIDGVQEALRGLAAAEQAIRLGSVTTVGNQLTKQGLRIVKELTPRQKNRNRLESSKRGGSPLWKQWEAIETVATEARYQAVIRNKARLDDQGALILTALEFGARPHAIQSHGKYPLKWRDTNRRFIGRVTTGDPARVEDVINNDRGSGIATALRVSHPGHRPFHMVKSTKQQLNSIADTLLAAFADQIERAFGEGFSAGVE